MKLIDFWQCLPGTWHFKRDISNGSYQNGHVNIIKISEESYTAFESGTYVNKSSQTFFRNYKFFWLDSAWHIHGENPKNGFVFLYKISDNFCSHVHHCGNDSYLFKLLQFSQDNWKSVIKVIGPSKNFTIITNYKLTKN